MVSKAILVDWIIVMFFGFYLQTNQAYKEALNFIL